MTTASQQHAVAGEHAPVPQVVASYAAYLHARTHHTPQTTITGDDAHLTLSIAGKALVLAFHCDRREWSLRRAELHHGEQTATFTRGKLADAVTALLRP